MMQYNPILSESYLCRRPPPANLADADLPLFENDYQYQAPETHRKTLRNVEISTQGRIFKHMWMLEESFVVPQHRSRGVVVRGTLHALKSRGRPDALDEGTWVADNWSAEYYHWLCDALPRLYLARQHDPRLTVLLPASHSGRPYIAATIEAFGIKPPLYLAPDRSTRVKTLHLPTHTALTGHVNEPVIRQVADVVTAAYGAPRGGDHPADRRVYLSRGLAPRRRITNEADVLPVLERHGFETFHFEQMDFKAQVRLMSQTRYLVSNHGAGLANLMFMPRGGAVLELRKAGDTIHNCFYNLAAAMGVTYFYQQCPPVDPAEPVWSANLVADPGKLDQELQGMLAGDEGKNVRS